MPWPEPDQLYPGEPVDVILCWLARLGAGGKLEVVRSKP